MFDIEQLKTNQRKHIASYKECMDNWTCDVPKNSPTDVGDSQIDLIFTHLNLYESDTVKLFSMKGPIDHVPTGLPLRLTVSRASNAGVDWFCSTFVADYTRNILRKIEDTVAILEKENKKYVYYFGMWIPVYAAYAKTDKYRAGIMLHYSQKALWENEDEV